MVGHILYILITASLFLALPADLFHSASSFLLVLGTIGLWRYSWAAINLVRALWYRHVAFPKMRTSADVAWRQGEIAGRAFFLITSYKIETAITVRVYRALFEAALHNPRGAIIVASVVEMADQHLIRNIYRAIVGDNARVQLEFVRIPGTGKRDALACGLAAIKSFSPTAHDIVALVDGDSCVPLNIVETTAPFFATNLNVGALTTDEVCEAIGSKLFQQWYNLRFAQRQMMMCSMGLSRRVLTLTGRLSVFRGDVAVASDFIEMVRRDEIEHWRLGDVKFLTGDDKSTWFWLLRSGYHMLYLPDVQSISMESQPRPAFVESATVLMVRWFGNMLRNNGRAMRLSPAKIGFFTWWSIVDQRLSMWSTLTGPIFAILATLFVDPLFLPAYIGWVMMTRYIYCALLMMFRPRFEISYPFLAYFNQIYGSFLKTWVFFRLNRQKWTRQGGGASTKALSLSFKLREYSSTYMHSLAIASLVTGVAVAGGLITLF